MQHDLPDEIVVKINELSIAAYPNEGCGFLVKNGERVRVIGCENTAPDKGNNFRISAADYSASASIGAIIGVWHSHVEIPNLPSAADIAGCEDSEVTWYIVSVRKCADGFETSPINVVCPEGKVLPYLGREYVFGSVDCYALVRDYYKKEYGLIMSNPPRIDEFWRKGVDVFGEAWENEGFVQINKQDFKIGDVFLINTGSKVLDHIAVYVGDDKILHHSRNRLSKIDVYAGFFRKHTVLHLRHKTLC